MKYGARPETVAESSDRSHRRLQHEAQSHRSFRPLKQIAPEAFDGLECEPVPKRAGND
jgi:hypothetical protein